MSGDDFAHAPAGRSAGFNCAFDGSDFAAHDCSYQTSIDLFPPHKRDVRAFHGSISSFNHRDEAATFD